MGLRGRLLGRHDLLDQAIGDADERGLKRTTSSEALHEVGETHRLLLAERDAQDIESEGDLCRRRASFTVPEEPFELSSPFIFLQEEALVVLVVEGVFGAHVLEPRYLGVDHGLLGGAAPFERDVDVVPARHIAVLVDQHSLAGIPAEGVAASIGQRRRLALVRVTEVQLPFGAHPEHRGKGRDPLLALRQGHRNHQEIAFLEAGEQFFHGNHGLTPVVVANFGLVERAKVSENGLFKILYSPLFVNKYDLEIPNIKKRAFTEVKT